MGRRGCTERACDSRAGGYEHRGEGGFRGVLLAIVGVVDGDHVFSLWLRQRQILVITRRFVNRSGARFPPEKGRFSYPPGKAPARRESVGRANVANRYKRAERSSRRTTTAKSNSNFSL
jgi:hypothetical protein